MPVFKWSKTASSNATADSTINWAEGQAPSSINDSARAEMAAVAKWRDDISGTITTGGSSTAYTVTTNSVFDSLANMSGAMIAFIPHATNGASPTLNVDGLGAKAINQSTGVAVTAGQLVLGTPYLVTYINATTEFILLGMIGTATFNTPLTVLSTDAGAGTGPSLTLDRNSASPAVSDLIGAVVLNGRNDAAATKTYLNFKGQLTNVTAGAEAAIWIFQQFIAGVLTTVLQSTASAWTSVLTFASTNVTAGLSLAGGTTGQRNGSPTAGDTRYNTTLNGIEYWNGAAWIVLGQAPTKFEFTSGTAATYTPTAGMVRIRVRMVGPGAGGGAQNTNNGGVASANTSFESWTAIKGSGGGANGTTGGAGGTGGVDGTGLRIIRRDGQAGQAGGGSATGTVSFPGGTGGSTPFGGGGNGAAFNVAGNAGKANTGGGGQGAGSNGNNAGSGGGAGEYVEFWMTAAQVGASVTYTVPAGGAAGAAGGTAGGAGAAAFIVVEEFYS